MELVVVACLQGFTVKDQVRGVVVQVEGSVQLQGVATGKRPKDVELLEGFELFNTGADFVIFVVYLVELGFELEA